MVIDIVVALLIFAFLCGGVAFVAALTGMGPWSTALLDDELIHWLLRLSLIAFVGVWPLLLYHFIWE